jgi:hypothetical protein
LQQQRVSMRALLLLCLVAGCRASAAPSPAAASDPDMRALLAELAGARTCERIESTFHAVPAGDSTGALWLRRCTASVDGAQIELRVEGDSWMPAGGAHARLAVTAVVRGALDIRYDAMARTASLRLAEAVPEVAIAPAAHQKLAPAIAPVVTAVLAGAARSKGPLLDLCGTLPGASVAGGDAAPAEPGAGEAALSSGDLVIVGPQLVERGLALHASARRGALRYVLVCAEHAPAVIEAHMANQRLEVPTLLSGDLTADTRVQLPTAKCPVVLVARALEDRAALAWRWDEPPRPRRAGRVACKPAESAESAAASAAPAPLRRTAPVR